MPSYPHFATSPIPWEAIEKRVGVMSMLGVPYGKAVTEAIPMAKVQAAIVAADIEKNGGPANLQEQEIVAIVAYIQRLGQDIKLANSPTATTPARANTSVPQVAARRTP